MVNTSLSWSSFVGIALALGGVGLYFIRAWKPRLARDYDIFFAAVAVLCGGILFFQGWRQDPILQFGQFLLTGSTIFFAFESVRLRGIATEQARRSTPIVDDERPVSPVYRYQAEFEELNPYEERTVPRRIRGSRDTRSSRDEYDDEETRRRPTTRSRNEDRLGTGDRPRKRRPRSDEGAGPREDVDPREERPSRSRSGPSTRSGNQSPGASGRPKRSRPTEDAPPPRRDPQMDEDEAPSPSEYVDYRPVDTDEEDNWGDY